MTAICTTSPHFKDVVAVDTETMGLKPGRDRLCLVQLSPGDGTVDMVKIEQGQTSAPNLGLLLTDPEITKVFHYARFDIAMLKHGLGIEVAPVWCTKIASRLARTYTDRHGLKDLARDLLGIDISKQQQSSDWGAAELTDAQLEYAASDVLNLRGDEDPAGGAAEARGAPGARRGLLRLPLHAGRARPSRLGRHRYFRPFLEHDPERERRFLAFAKPASACEARSDKIMF